MMNVTITKDFGIGKAQAAAKAKLTEIIMAALVAEFGEDNVAMIRTGSSPTNEIGVRMGTLTEIDGFEYELCAAVNPTIKGHKEKVTKNYTVPPFDFEDARKAYTTDVAKKAADKVAKAEEKEKKIAADKAAREAKRAANAAKSE